MKIIILIFLFCMSVTPVWGATFYIDPDCANNGDGTTTACASGGGGTGAYNTWYGLTLTSNNNYYQKRGTTDTWADKETTNYQQRIILDTLSNITIGAYGTGARPIIESYFTSTSADDWTDLGGNVWQLDVVAGVEWVNQPYPVGFGTLGTDGDRVPYNDVPAAGTNPQEDPDANREWDSDVYNLGAGDTNLFWTYGTSVPTSHYGTIYFTTQQSFIFLLRNPTNITIQDIHFKYAFNAVKIAHDEDGTYTGVIIQNNKFTSMRMGVNINDGAAQITSGAIIRNNECVNAGTTCVTLTDAGVLGTIVEHNTATDCGQTESVACFYLNDTSASANKNIIRYNTVSGGTYGKYWIWDGHGVLTESDSRGTDVYGNIINYPLGSCLGSNSGLPDSNFYNNICTSRFGVRGSDSSSIGDSDISITNNTFNCNDATNCINITGQANDAYTLKNNVINSTNNTDYCISANSNIHASSIETNNAFNGCDVYDIYNSTTTAEVAIDSTSISSDPLLNSDNCPQEDSPVLGVGAGTKHNGLTADIGAFQSTKHIDGYFGCYPINSDKNEVTLP